MMIKKLCSIIVLFVALGNITEKVHADIFEQYGPYFAAATILSTRYLSTNLSPIYAPFL